MHLTETCEEDNPHLITHVATTPATTTDEAMTEPIHADLEQSDLTPRQHLLDTGYITAPLLVTSQQQYGIEVIGPARVDVKWQPTRITALMEEGSSLIGKTSRRFAPKDGRVSVGLLPLTTERTRSSKSSSPQRIAASVLS